MKISSSGHKFILILAALGILIGGILVFFPWRPLLAGKIKTALEGHGFQNVTLSVGGLGWRGLTLNDVSLGGQTPLTLKNIALVYTLKDIWNRRLGGITVSGLSIELIQKDHGWSATGLEGIMGGSKTSSALTIPVTRADLAQIPFDHFGIQDSAAQISAKQWHADFPVDLDFDKSAIPKISYKTDHMMYHMHNLDAALGPAVIDMQLDEAGKKWQGSWKINDIKITQTSTPIPVLQGSGTIIADSDTVIIAGVLQSADQSWLADFTLHESLKDAALSNLTIASVTLPWKEGRLSARDIKMMVSGKQSTTINLQVSKVSIDQLMKSLTGQKVSATGLVSGTLPVIIGANGGLTFKQGNLQAEGPGTIAMPPEAIPSDNQQITLVRDILKDLHYSQLSISMDSDPKNALSVILTVEGNNPAVYDGRLVKLNLHLTGDVLDFIQENLMFLTDPKTLMEQGRGEKK